MDILLTIVAITTIAYNVTSIIFMIIDHIKK